MERRNIKRSKEGENEVKIENTKMREKRKQHKILSRRENSKKKK